MSTPSSSDPKQLRALLFRLTKTARDKAVEEGGHVSAATVESLQRLERLIELSEAAQPPIPRKRWPAAVMLVVTLAAVSALLFLRVSETDVELDVIASEVRFSLSSEQVLTDILPLTALGVAGVMSAQLPAGLHAAPASPPSSEILLTAVGADATMGSVSLAPLVAPAGATVGIRRTGVARQFRISLEHSGKEVRADLYGNVRVAWAGDRGETVDFAVPRALTLATGVDETDLDLTTAGPVSFAAQIQVKELSFTRIDEFGDGDRTLIFRLSTLLSGTLYRESLNGEAFELRPAEALRFGHIQGEIRALEIEGDHIALKFQGSVRGMNTGMDSARRSLMPTYLEWLSARHGLTLLWGTTLYVFGLVVTLARWWTSR